MIFKSCAQAVHHVLLPRLAQCTTFQQGEKRGGTRTFRLKPLSEQWTERLAVSTLVEADLWTGIQCGILLNLIGRLNVRMLEPR